MAKFDVEVPIPSLPASMPTWPHDPGAYDVLLQQAQTIEGLRKMLETKESEIMALRGHLQRVAERARALEEAMEKKLS